MAAKGGGDKEEQGKGEGGGDEGVEGGRPITHSVVGVSSFWGGSG